jgi:hypothetical protein
VSYTNSGQSTPYNSTSLGTQWGEVTGASGDQMFDMELQNFTAPMLSGADANLQLGYVSSLSNQSTGVVFWGNAPMVGGGCGSGVGTLDGSRARLHIEIWDDRAASGAATQISVHIGYDQSGFVSAQGSGNGGSANLTFTDSVGSVALVGTIQGTWFSGTMSYNNGNSGWRTLGQFRVPAAGFFTCN